MSENEGRRLVACLTAAGFTTAGEHSRGYYRLVWPEGDGTLVVPVDDTAPEYEELLSAAKTVLRRAVRRGRAARHALDLHRMEVS